MMIVTAVVLCTRRNANRKLADYFGIARENEAAGAADAAAWVRSAAVVLSLRIKLWVTRRPSL